jgi:DNA-directed RNA polymerase sigma subunit (sigma70/sigma32)
VSKTTTQTKTRIEVDVALRQANLTSEEEKVLRMRYGIGMAPEGQIEARTAINAEAQAQIAAIELKAIGHVRRQQAVINRLRRIDG